MTKVRWKKRPQQVLAHLVHSFETVKHRIPSSSISSWVMLTTCLAWATACGSSDVGHAARGSSGKSNESTHGGGAAGRSSSGFVNAGASSGGSGSGGTGNAGGGATGVGSVGGATAGSGYGGSAASSGSAGKANLGGATGSGGTNGSISDKLVPTSGALLGQFYGDGDIRATKIKLGRTLLVHLTYWGWDEDWTSGDTKADIAAGRIPLVNWEPEGIDFETIVDGSQDATIKARAAGAKALAVPFFLDFAAEANGDEAWSDNDAELYVDAYRHIHDLFVAAGATNVVWAWCPNVVDTDGTNAATLSYYPGDSYVDWTGVDGYNWGADDWQSFKEVFKDIYPLLAGKKKPILIGEMASSPTGGDKGAWINAIIPALKNDFPLIKGVIWFDTEKERDWRISSSSATESAFRALAADPFFSH